MIFKDENLLVVCIMRVSIFMSENIPSAVDWYYLMPNTKLSSAKGVKPIYIYIFLFIPFKVQLSFLSVTREIDVFKIVTSSIYILIKVAI